MAKKKDLFVRLVPYFLCFFLVACGGSGSSPETPPAPPEPVVPEPTPPADPPDDPPPAPTPPDPVTPPLAPIGNEILPVLPPGSAPVFTGKVSVTFSLEVPQNTPNGAAIYITGDFENWSGGGDPDYQLSLVNDLNYQISLEFDAGATIQYKFTRGSWSVEEVDDLGNQVGNRTTKLRDQDLTVNAVVPNWLDTSEPIDNPDSGYWNTATPDYSESTIRPEITLNGAQTIVLNVGESYVEEGATGQDPQDGDISDLVQVQGTPDTQNAGDYVVNYTLQDADGNFANDVMRLVRVKDDQTIRYSTRAVGQTPSHLGYIEQLPANYGEDPDQKYPVLIYHHGGGGDAASLDLSPTNSLVNIVIYGGGPATIAVNGDWNPESPLIVLTPQRSVLRNPSISRMNAFVDFALENYQIDPTRIYMTGHSQGGRVSWQYAVAYPNRAAAIAPLAGGFFNIGIPSNICDASSVAVWAFHSVDDNVISSSIGRSAVDALNACNPAERARFTLFDGLGHQSHTYVLSLAGMGNALSSDDLFDENLYQWMMQQRKE